MRSERGPAFDPCWAGAQVTTVLGPLAPDPDDVERRHTALLEAMPPGSWWRDRPGPVTTVVDDDLTAAALEAGGRPWSGPPVRVLVGPRDVAVVHSHGIGDARTSRALVHDLLAPGGSPFLLPGLRPAPRLRVVRAAAACWGRHPRRLVSALRRPDPRPAGPGDPAPTPDAPVLLTRAVPVGALRARRDRDHPGVTLSAVLLAGLVGELGARGIGPEVVSMPVDLRRYLGEHRQGGNLVALLRLTPDPDPAVLDRERRLAVDGGEPLVRYLAGRARGHVRTVAPTALREGWPTLGWSDRGRVGEWEDLPWGVGPRRVAAGLVPVWGHRIGVHLTRLGDVLHVACVVNAAAFAPRTVADALDAVLDAAPTATPALLGEVGP
ncbi:hypothetical protein [Actinomycetospora sp. TBRC 11914]|uniref:hypothetical protein n=1 Tax=Actinomycetospora sp. TBRC 11914 TaxID=2729387 RepID=UPI00145FCEC6|nr:hypothetical protein [Actinomycetospora sp. TBRC 11914]NMO92973.1 hypothetical protein [Actinomycetospora sp. TBRC 11914]